MEFDIVIYHKGCPDGIASAWIYWRKNKSAKFVEMDAGRYPKDLEVKGKRLLFVDVCPKKDETEQIAKEAKEILIIDHHESATLEIVNLPNTKFIFDMERSGCQITWDIFNTGKMRPWFLEIIADRDLWKFEQKNTKELSAYLSSNGYYSFEKLEELLNIEESNIPVMVKIGNVINKMNEKQYTDPIKNAIDTFVTIGSKTYKVKLTQGPHNIVSEVGSRLSRFCDFAAIYRYDLEHDAWWISCRASKEGINLSEICRHFGGGGHAKSAGFSIKNTEGALQKIFQIPESN